MRSLPSCSDYLTAIMTPSLIKTEVLKGGKPIILNKKLLRYAGGFCMVFPYNLANGNKVAIRCWIAHINDLACKSIHISKYLKEISLPYFVEFEYIEQGLITPLGIVPIIIMEWIEAVPLKEYIKAHINDSKCMRQLAASFLNMVTDLHKVNLSHGDLQHGNIMVSPDGKLFLVDYDSMFVPGLEGELDEIKGLSGYQHPSRITNKTLSPKIDYFSELIIYTSLLSLSKVPFLWDELKMEETETLFFNYEDFTSPNQSYVFDLLKSEPELSNYVIAIEKALLTNDINELQPLEKVIGFLQDQSINNIQNKWLKSPITPITNNIINIDEVKARWNQFPSPSTEYSNIDISIISNKWKK